MPIATVKPTARQKRNRRDWFEALESGRYSRTEGNLAESMKNKKVGYCCLGVDACTADIPKRRAVDLWTKKKAKVFEFDFGEEKLTDFPPTDWFAKRHGLSSFHANEIIALGAELNDDGYKFKKTAAVLREAFRRADLGLDIDRESIEAQLFGTKENTDEGLVW